MLPSRAKSPIVRRYSISPGKQFLEDVREFERPHANPVNCSLESASVMPEATANPYVEVREGGYYLSGTRVGLDTIVHEFQAGKSPEAILQSYPAIGSLAKVYGAITFIQGFWNWRRLTGGCFSLPTYAPCLVISPISSGLPNPRA